MNMQPAAASGARKMTRKMAEYNKGNNPLACYLDAASRLPDSDLLALFPIVEEINREYSTKKVRELGAAL